MSEEKKDCGFDFKESVREYVKKAMGEKFIDSIDTCDSDRIIEVYETVCMAVLMDVFNVLQKQPLSEIKNKMNNILSDVMMIKIQQIKNIMRAQAKKEALEEIEENARQKTKNN